MKQNIVRSFRRPVQDSPEKKELRAKRAEKGYPDVIAGDEN